MSDTTYDNAHAVHSPLAWKAEEFTALAIALAVLTVWIASTVVFGFAGLILPALALVAASFVALVVISRG